MWGCYRSFYLPGDRIIYLWKRGILTLDLISGESHNISDIRGQSIAVDVQHKQLIVAADDFWCLLDISSLINHQQQKV